MALTIQEYAALTSLIAAILIIAVVLFLIFTAKKYEDKEATKAKVYKARGRYFLFLTPILLIILVYSFQFLPYPQFQKKADVVVTVVSAQWYWLMAKGESEIPPEEFIGDSEITVPVNKTINFVLKTKDVNHNFAIYNSKGDLVAQAQSMPGYTNELYHVFTEPGDYLVLCLEYCGLNHARMTATIHVADPINEDRKL